MKSILGVVKDFGLPNEVIYDSNLKPIFFKHFCVLNFVFCISKIEQLKKINFITHKNFQNMTISEATKFLDKYDLVIQFSNKFENIKDYIKKFKKKFIFIESPVYFRNINQSLLSQKYLRIMTENHLGNNFIKKYNKIQIRDDLSFPKIQNRLGESILLINQMINDSAVYPIDPYKWASETISEIRKYSDRKIIFRDHPLQKTTNKNNINNILENYNVVLGSNNNIENDLKLAKCCVTLSSGSAVDSLFFGVPVIATDERSFVYEIVENDLKNIENLKIPNLEGLKSALSHTHFTLSEILNGKCWNSIKEFIN